MRYTDDAPVPARDRGTPIAIAAYYFWSLAGLAIAYPYLPLYWKSLGLPTWQIGALLTALGLGGLVAQVPLGYLSDRGGKRRRFIFAAMAIGGVTMAVYGLLHSFWFLLVVTLLQSASFRSADALVQALVGDWVAGTRMASAYGRVRMAGSLAWAGALLLSMQAAFMTDWHPIGGMRWAAPMFLYVAGCNFAAAVSILLARSRPAASRLHLGPITALRTVAQTPGVGRFLLAMLLFWTGLQSISSFLSLFLKELGAGRTIVSTAFVISSVAEIPFIVLAGRLAEAWGERRLLMVAFAVMPLRLLINAVMPSPYWAFGSQALHSVTYGLALVGAVAFMNHRLPTAVRASGQAALGVAMSLSNTAAPFAGAIVAQWLGYRGAFAAMAVVSLAGWGVLAGIRELHATPGPPAPGNADEEILPLAPTDA